MKPRYRLLLFAALLTLNFLVSSGAQTQRVRIGILVYEGVFNTEFMAPLDVFDHAARLVGGQIEVFTVGPDAGSVTTAEDLRILPRYSFATVPAIDWLVVPSGENYREDMKNPALVAWIHRVGAQAQVVHSNCWGAFLLGAAGLLDGKQATTFPQNLDDLAQRFTAVKVRRNLALVDDDGVVTSAGGVVSYDAALYLVEKYFGAEVADKVAEGLVIDWAARRQQYLSAGTGANW